MPKEYIKWLLFPSNFAFVTRTDILTPISNEKTGEFASFRSHKSPKKRTYESKLTFIYTKVTQKIPQKI